MKCNFKAGWMSIGGGSSKAFSFRYVFESIRCGASPRLLDVLDLERGVLKPLGITLSVVSGMKELSVAVKKNAAEKFARFSAAFQAKPGGSSFNGTDRTGSRQSASGTCRCRICRRRPPPVTRRNSVTASPPSRFPRVESGPSARETLSKESSSSRN